MNAFLTTVKRWKQLKCLSTFIHGERIKKMCHIHTIEDFSAIERNEVLRCATNWMILKNVTPSLKRQTQRVIYCMYLYEISRIGNRDRQWPRDSQRLGGGREGVVNGYEVFFGINEIVLN